MDLPFDGAISDFYENEAPKEIRNAIKRADKGDLITNSYPYSERLSRKIYEKDLKNLQTELVKLQHWVKESGARVVVVFEGRDASGKGGTIKRFREFLNPRGARIVALPKPTETERTQWYFQRYIEHLPAAGEIVFFDRSWYNRAVVEHVFEFCSNEEREKFFKQVNDVEQQFVDDGIMLFKFWLNVGRAEQLRRFMDRESDPLKQWKLSWIDVEGLKRWHAYTAAIVETLARSHSPTTPWHVIRSDDKRRARLEALRLVLHGINYERKDLKAIGGSDHQIAGGPDIWDA